MTRPWWSSHADATIRTPRSVPPMPEDAPTPPPPVDPDFTVEEGLVVFSAAFHRRRGTCCGSGCRHCPYLPRHRQGATVLAAAEPRRPTVGEA